MKDYFYYEVFYKKITGKSFFDTTSPIKTQIRIRKDGNIAQYIKAKNECDIILLSAKRISSIAIDTGEKI